LVFLRGSGFIRSTSVFWPWFVEILEFMFLYREK
jgi:hypothetical protein